MASWAPSGLTEIHCSLRAGTRPEAVIVAGGFRPDYARCVHIPGAFDAHGFPLHDEGASTVADGLHFAGVHFLRTRKSTLFIGIGEDAAIVAGKVAT